jgi:hypothetical protein
MTKKRAFLGGYLEKIKKPKDDLVLEVNQDFSNLSAMEMTNIYLLVTKYEKKAYEKGKADTLERLEKILNPKTIPATCGAYERHVTHMIKEFVKELKSKEKESDEI